ncbi:hypothetical protein ACFL35_08345 [Candidatus Riflebacteria bacterium]
MTREKIAISTGSACSSGALGPSHVLKALKMDKKAMEGAFRFGLGKFITDAQIFIEAVNWVKRVVS